MSSFKLQYGDDIRRKSIRTEISYDGLKKIIVNTFLNPENEYKIRLSYQDADEDLVTIANSEDLQQAFEHHSGEILKIGIQAKEIDVKAKAFKRAFRTGLKVLEGGEPESAIPYFAEALRLRKDPASAYNIACAFSLLNNLFESLKWLRAAVDLGYANFLWAVRDPDLANIRETEEFEQLVAEMRNKAVPPFFRRFCGPCRPQQQQQAERSGGCCGSPAARQCQPQPRAQAQYPVQQPPQQPPVQPRPQAQSPPPPVAPPAAPVAPVAPAASAPPSYVPPVESSESDFGPEQAQLAAMGFTDAKHNHQLLVRFNGDVIKAVHELLFN